IESLVNREIWAATPVVTEVMPYAQAVAGGAMALFGEKYGAEVRVVTMGAFSKELCGGTHVRNTAEIGVFVLVAESGVAAGVRRVEALTARAAFDHLRRRDQSLVEAAAVLKAPVDQLAARVSALVEERKGLEKRLAEAMKGGGGALASVLAAREDVGGVPVVRGRVSAPDMKALQAMGDALREQLGTGVGVLAASLDDGKAALLAVVTDDLRARGVAADALVRELAARVGGRGGGKAHMAQAGIPDAEKGAEALAAVPALVRAAVGA
nr:DHHA1 domain-containing protein [Gemmatimonadaceae bacterium]